MQLHLSTCHITLKQNFPCYTSLVIESQHDDHVYVYMSRGRELLGPNLLGRKVTSYFINEQLLHENNAVLQYNEVLHESIPLLYELNYLQRSTITCAPKKS